jgi:hypothetical protein
MKTIPKLLCRIVSAIGFACSAFCLWYIISGAISIFGSSSDVNTPPYFIVCYLGLSLIAGTIAIIAAIGSLDLARLKIRGARLLTIASILPYPLWIMVGMSWFTPIGRSMAAATGVGLGGLMPMSIWYLPIWAGLVWLLAFRPSQKLTQATS